MSIIKEKIKIFWKPFVLVFLISFVIINWVDFGWVFNYKAVSGVASDFLKENQDEVLSPSDSSQPVLKEKSEEVKKEDSLEIPKINISVPLVLIESQDEEEIHQALDQGVVHFPKSVLPGQTGQTIILGHSAPPGWPKIKHDWVFSQLNELNEGDEVLVYFDYQKYSYSVTKTVFLERGEEIPEEDLTNYTNVLYLLSCWPPGKDYRRIAVEAILKNK